MTDRGGVIRAVDDFLIDGVFQPVADRLAGWVSCYGIAAFVLTGFLLALLVREGWEGEWVWCVLDVVVYAPRLFRAYWLDARPASDVLPPDRAVSMPLRVGSLVYIPCLNVFAMMASRRFLHYLAFGALWYGFVVGIYFMACRKNPPKRREVRLPAGLVAVRAR